MAGLLTDAGSKRDEVSGKPVLIMSTTPTPELCDISLKRQPAFWSDIVAPILITAFHLFLYGLYVLLFRIGIVVLRKWPNTRDHLVHKVSLNILFSLTSLSVPLNLVFDIGLALCWFRSHDILLKFIQLSNVLVILRLAILLLIGLTIDMILVGQKLKCYHVFGLTKHLVRSFDSLQSQATKDASCQFPW
ncbi:hypothetical protein E1B28_005359 [Marasmius oreades]|uniref:Uncharacterized protein n=1 Tax=Marasmius oreades TaxID=181124 RepID=A0A9P7S3D2_9AGAR|nr:uncharacterized protein E1B28_005359 [Marasmius oreades]KAG7094530.1 hypothetical protein E1B28_005359 [Marasmius oreades]